MESKRGKLGTQPRRQREAKAKLIVATIALISEQGLFGFSIAEVEQRAGVGRGLAGYHFKSSGALIYAAATDVLLDDAGTSERGLPQMVGWFEDGLERAAAKDPRLVATLQVVLGPKAVELQDLKEVYWRRETERLQQHLSAAKALQQVSSDIDPERLAPVMLAMLHGEQQRLIAMNATPQATFVEILKHALAVGPTPKAGRKSAAAQNTVPDLFD